MYRRRGYRRFPIRRRKYVRRARSRYGKKKTGLRSMVKKMINRKLETKEYVQSVIAADCNFQQNSAGLVTNTFSLIPPIVQGTADGQRISDKISIQGLKYKFHIYHKASNTRLLSDMCRVVIFSLKDYQQSSAGVTLPSVEASNFFRSGTGTATSNGLLQNDCLLPINTNRIIVHHDRTFVLGSQVTAATGSGYSTSYPLTCASIPGFKHFNISIKKNLKKWVFDENATNPNYPVNHNLWCAVFINPIDNSSDPSPTSAPISVVSVADIKYKDG